MPNDDARYETPKWRMLALLVAFAVLTGIGVVTVLLPELEDEPETTSENARGTNEEEAHTDALQE